MRKQTSSKIGKNKVFVLFRGPCEDSHKCRLVLLSSAAPYCSVELYALRYLWPLKGGGGGYGSEEQTCRRRGTSCRTVPACPIPVQRHMSQKPEITSLEVNVTVITKWGGASNGLQDKAFWVDGLFVYTKKQINESKNTNKNTSRNTTGTDANSAPTKANGYKQYSKRVVLKTIGHFSPLGSNDVCGHIPSGDVISSF